MPGIRSWSRFLFGRGIFVRANTFYAPRGRSVSLRRLSFEKKPPPEEFQPTSEMIREANEELEEFFGSPPAQTHLDRDSGTQRTIEREDDENLRFSNSRIDTHNGPKGTSTPETLRIRAALMEISSHLEGLENRYQRLQDEIDSLKRRLE
mmetsp:Transcript_21103/g.51636  ORF Transcript_21103/g.51636 Transcript_21103/m.51636 type:complete len:150 (-) Transcript_21103:174-623(-)